MEQASYYCDENLYVVVAAIDRQPAPVGKGDCPGCCDIVRGQKYYFRGRMIEFAQTQITINGFPFIDPQQIECEFENVRQTILSTPSVFNMFHEMDIVAIVEEQDGNVCYLNALHKPGPVWSYVVSLLDTLDKDVPLGDTCLVL